MNIQQQNGTLTILGLRELSAANAHSFRDEASAALKPHLHAVEIDFSEAGLVDSCGLGALVSLYKAANHINNNGGVTMRLLNPPPPVQQMFELTRMHHLFEIVRRNEEPEPQVPPASPAKKGEKGAVS
jgi:anti-sigma B factor antagonist